MYQWTKKFETNVVNGLRDRRGQVNGIYDYRCTTLTINRQRNENNQAMINEKHIYV
ncbi:hypothetical protein [Lysinibacillus fusiformis]|uniref:hypothetical protein n=1 Tax=Lysinibacillus fusiformis TaxID=28031 RepID=UPI0018808A31|nr:hypothetical protein [Lysinibacillus fusiformis]MBD8521444.1 hypothetical protein [Lysinibacillus fusiformis]MED4886242.1 hypothetical protein [Lysinibacillus fusiformis]